MWRFALPNPSGVPGRSAARETKRVVSLVIGYLGHKTRGKNVESCTICEVIAVT